MLCRYRTWITANALATNRRVYGSIASAADQALLWGGQLGAATCEVIVTGTPGALQVLTPQMSGRGRIGHRHGHSLQHVRCPHHVRDPA